MSTQTQLDRLVGAKTSLKSSIKKKGVRVPDSVKMDGLSAYVDNIKQLDTSDATATASDIAKGKTAYINGTKVTGTYEPTPGDADTGSGGGSDEAKYYIEIVNDLAQSITIDCIMDELNGRTFLSGDTYVTSDRFTAIDILTYLTITCSIYGETYDTDLQVNAVLNDVGNTITLWITPM